MERIKKIAIPSLIIHGELDSLIPVEEGKDLYQFLGTDQKQLLIISSANHNDILFVGLKMYFEALQRFIEKTDESP